MDVSFRLNGQDVTLHGVSGTTTLLDWLRVEQKLTGTKEGCNEGDCGACSVMVTDDAGAKALNACILFLPQLHGKSIRTVEGISAPDGTPHPVQSQMVDLHGSQCGFCTPGFVVSMATAHLNGQKDHDTVLAGNLCRCTGYAPIIRAAQASETAKVPAHMHDDLPQVETLHEDHPTDLDGFSDWYEQNPQATLIAGATDVGLWVTKQFRDLGQVAFLNRIKALRGIEITQDEIRIGAMATVNEVLEALDPIYPSFGEMLRRYGSHQVRNAATIGGNIANGSPIGDSPPALIALGARLHLRKGAQERVIDLQDFFIEYGKQDRQIGEFVTAISIPREGDHLHCAKLSKRFDQDISAVCGCFWIKVEEGKIREARLAYGGMAGIPDRASHAESELIGQDWNVQTIQRAMAAMTNDFSPLSDMRASAAYRMKAAQNMLLRAFHERDGTVSKIKEVWT